MVTEESRVSSETARRRGEKSILGEVEMANLKEHYLSELRVYSSFLEDSLLAILHTIMYVRAPGDIKPQDRMCEALCPLIYATVGPSDVERDIK